MAKEYALRFYKSKAWKECRLAYLKSKFYLCERCGNFGNTVHHKIYITPKSINDPKVTLNHANLEVVCDSCHNQEHKTSKKNLRYKVDEFGNILPP